MNILHQIFIIIYSFALNQAPSIEKDMVFMSDNQNIELAATINLAGASAQKAAVLLPVAGPTDRDLTLGKHRYFKTLAQYLAQQGIASIRFDDRGTGQSNGEFLQTTFKDRAQDACSARKALSNETGISIERIGYIGISEGSGVAIQASQLCPAPAFLVLLSAPVRKGTVELAEQMQRLLSQSALSIEQRSEIQQVATELFNILNSDQPELQKSRLTAIFASHYGPMLLPAYHFVPQSIEGRVDFVLSKWYQSQIRYNIDEVLGKISNIPTLAIYGKKDQVINIEENLMYLNKHHTQLSYHVMESINHLMQYAQTGSPLEYAQLSENFSQEIADILAQWINAITLP